MAEAEKKDIISKILPAKNFFKRVANFFGFKFHYTPTPGTSIGEIPVFKRIQQVLDYKTVDQLNRLMVETEKKWDGIPTDKHFSDNVAYYRNELLKLYTADDKSELNESIGPFTDKKQLDIEGNYAQYGTNSTLNESIIIRRDGLEFKGEFSIPEPKPIIYDDGRAGTDDVTAYKVAFFGHTNDPYWIKLKDDINTICDKFKNGVLPHHNDATIKGNIAANIDFYRDVAHLRMKNIQDFVNEVENKHRANLTGAGGVIKLYNTLDKLKSQIGGLKLTDEQVHFTHTFKVVKPVIRDSNGVITDRLSNHIGHNWDRLLEEVDHGLDEHGWSLEVGDGHTKFEGRTLGEGVVLLDIYKNRGTIRKVPKQFITDLDPLLSFTLIYVYYDAYRDDIRDARYHQQAITVIERIKSELGLLSSEQRKNVERGVNSKESIKLHKLPDGTKPGRFATDPKYVTSTVKPTNLLPAFDLRASGKTKHRGRMYYYETQNESVQSIEPTMSTRGAAMYILHRVIEETKYWGGTGDPSTAGVLEILRAIGEETGGFDIGPNMGDGEVGWGKPLTKNPFDPSR